MQKRIPLIFLLFFILINGSACVGMVVGQAADAVIEVGKIPFKVGGAVIDVATGDGDEEKDDK